MDSGPDIAKIQCWVPTDCCPPDVCNVTEEQFVCAIRSLLPEGEPYNNTRKYIPSMVGDPSAAIGCATVDCGELGVIDGGPPKNKGAIYVGCARVGCEQMMFGGCCDVPIPCEDFPLAPQLAIVDAFGAVVYDVVQAICKMLMELDPCTARYTLHRWADRMGITHPDPCGPGWSDQMLALLICLFVRLRYFVWNLESLRELAALFGLCIEIHYAGDLCGPPGWWTMARDLPSDCPPQQICPPGPITWPVPYIRMVSTCWAPALSLNIVVCEQPGCSLPPNCNLPPRPSNAPPFDPAEMLEAFKWLLGQVLPGNVSWCIYVCNESDCIPVPAPYQLAA